MPSEKNLCQLEKENPRPRKVVAELTVKKETLQEVVAANYDACSRTLDDRLCVWCVWRVDSQGLSHHSTCRATYHHQSRRPEQALLRKRIRERAETHVRYGYRRITVLLQREGWHVSVKRVHRPYSLRLPAIATHAATPACTSSATTAAMRRDPTGSGRWIGGMTSCSMAEGCGFSRRHLEPRVPRVVRGNRNAEKPCLIERSYFGRFGSTQRDSFPSSGKGSNGRPQP